MKKIILLISLCIGITHNTNAQSLRWGGSGGSSDGAFSGTDETVVDMATDPNGNVYVLWNGGQSGVGPPTTYYVDGHAIPGYGNGDILLTSYRCDGTYRWTKVFGGNSVDAPAAVKTDALGGVYVTGTFGVHYVNVHLDSDTTWSTGASYKDWFIVKYDTAGNYKWVRMPAPDTAALYSGSRPLDMDVDSTGNIYAFVGLYPGLYGGSYVVSDTGAYVLQFNSSGTLLGGTHMQIGYTGIGVHALYMKKDFALGRYYITGPGAGAASIVNDLTFNGESITQPVFVGAFDNTGTFLWVRENTSGLGDYFGRTAIDADHNIYLAGNSSAFTTIDTFNNYAIINPLSTHGNSPLFVKMDTAGNNIWIKNAFSQYAAYSNTITLNGSSVTVAGSYNGELLCPGFDSLNHPFMSGMGYDVFVIQMDATTGNFTKLDSITSGFPDDEYATGITADTHGNVYIGGNMDGDVYINGDTLVSNGGGSDFFVAKYGYDNCGCTTTPVASYSYTGAPTVNFTYTGTTTGLDSVIWNFGDGSHATGTTASHTYDTGTYSACVTAYTSCGSNISCQNIAIGSSAVANVAFQNLAVYPNPAADALFIENAPMGATVTLFNVMGQQVYSGTITSNKQQLSTSNLPGGNYILQFTDSNGNRLNKTIVKQ